MSIEVKNLVKTFGERRVIDGVSFKVEDGETLAIVGFSGSGKSTILKLICGLTKPDSGEIITSEGDIAMVFQYSALFDSLNVADNIAFALRERKELRNKYTEKEIRKIVSEKLELVGLKGIERKFPSELSGGMQKRVSFARAIVTEPKTILYDEPTAGLDPISSTLIEDYIVRLKEETHAASVVVTHQMSTITRTADRVIMLYNGKVVFEGTPDDMLRQDNEYTKQFVMASLEGPMKMLAEG
jgi:phospholipid/cholesterol/gamma-HCH transport system ATP-binding protein